MYHKRPGKVVQTKTGMIGRTYNDKSNTNGKTPVYLTTGLDENGMPEGYIDSAILCERDSLKVIGFID